MSLQSARQAGAQRYAAVLAGMGKTNDYIRSELMRRFPGESGGTYATLIANGRRANEAGEKLTRQGGNYKLKREEVGRAFREGPNWCYMVVLTLRSGTDPERQAMRVVVNSSKNMSYNEVAAAAQSQARTLGSQRSQYRRLYEYMEDYQITHTDVVAVERCI